MGFKGHRSLGKRCEGQSCYCLSYYWDQVVKQWNRIKELDFTPKCSFPLLELPLSPGTPSREGRAAERRIWIEEAPQRLQQKISNVIAPGGSAMEKHPKELKKTFQFLRHRKLFWFQAAHLEKTTTNKQQQHIPWTILLEIKWQEEFCLRTPKTYLPILCCQLKT